MKHLSLAFKPTFYTFFVLSSVALGGCASICGVPSPAVAAPIPAVLAMEVPAAAPRQVKNDDPAVIGQTNAGSVYAFSYDENGQHVSCQTRVKLDKQQQIVPQQQWGMKCISTPVVPPRKPLKATTLNLKP